jgi:hypothetical protein
VFFVMHGELLRKVDNIGQLARMGASQRMAQVNTEAVLGVHRAADEPGPPTEANGSGATRVSSSAGGERSAAPPAAGNEPGFASRRGACPRWEEATSRTAAAFSAVSRIARVAVLYFSGPLASLDRITCEGTRARRVVIFYWPTKIGRALGLLPPATTLAVDPFIDIGVPFNNYTVIYAFISELGLWAGVAAWLAVALLLRAFIRWSVRPERELGLIVAGVAPLAIAVRSPWTNSFFDGTLLIWICVAAGAALAARLGSSVARRERVEAAAGGLLRKDDARVELRSPRSPA